MCLPVCVSWEEIPHVPAWTQSPIWVCMEPGVDGTLGWPKLYFCSIKWSIIIMSNVKLLSQKTLPIWKSRGLFVWALQWLIKNKALHSFLLALMYVPWPLSKPADILCPKKRKGKKQLLIHFHFPWSTFTQSHLWPHSSIWNLHKLSTDFSNNLNFQTSLAEITAWDPLGIGIMQNKLPLIVMLWPSSFWLLFSLAAAWGFVVSTK